jgi:hypothetical protein
MANLLGRATMAVVAGYQAAVDTWTAGGRESTSALASSRRAELQELWARYKGTTFDAQGRALSIRQNQALYRHTRQLYNPVRVLVDFYAGVVYPGRVRTPDEAVPPGVPEAIPLGGDTPDELAAAVFQWMEWAGWQSEKAVMVRYGAAQGSVLLEIVDDWERGKVSADLWRADYVADIVLDRAGNPKLFTLEYPIFDGAQRHTYKRTVDGEVIRTYRDGQPYGYDGRPAEQPHPYGFCPARWARHTHTGDDWGAAAIAGSLGLIDELNSAASVMADTELKRLNAPVLIKAKHAPSRLGAAATARAGSEFSADARAAERESIPYWHTTDTDAAVEPLWPAVGGGEARTVEWLLARIEEQHPEIALWRHMREMSQVTGPGAARLVGDVTARVQEAASEYDRQLKAAAQMAVAIGGFRLAEGAEGWARDRRTRQQERFAGFGLDSWAAGNLDFTILPRPLLPSTEGERADESLAWFNAAKAALDAGLPLEAFLREERGWDEERLANLSVAAVAEIERRQRLAQADVVDGIDQ